MHKELQRIRHGYYDLWFGTNAVYERWAKSHGLNNNLLLTLYLLKEFPNDCTQHLICEKLMLPKQTVNNNSPATKVRIKDLGLPEDTIIGGIVRGDKVFIAVDNMEIIPYDRVVVFAMPGSVGKVGYYFN